MQTNRLPRYDDSDNPTTCCPRFNDAGWDDQTLDFQDKPFLRAETRSVMHIPLNMGGVHDRVLKRMRAAGAYDAEDYIVLSRDLSPWRAEHLWSLPAPVPDEETTTLTGTYRTKVFEGPYSQTGTWMRQMQELSRQHGGTGEEVWFFYTTCPKCAKTYGRNPVVGLARIA